MKKIIVCWVSVFFFILSRFVNLPSSWPSLSVYGPESYEFLFQSNFEKFFMLMTSFHNMFILLALSMILWCVLSVFLSIIFSFKIFPKFEHGGRLEFLWTLSPFIFLLVVAFPSLSLLYMMDEGFTSPSISIKGIGHQWFWTYELVMSNLQHFFSFLKSNDSGGSTFLETESYVSMDDGNRLLDVSESLNLKMNKEVRLLISSSDVLHSWALPSLNLKVDALPGRMNNLNLVSNHEGIFYGQCSELCGANHSFMPISVIFS